MPECPSRAEPLEPRRLLSTVLWDGGGDGDSWNDAKNWTGDVIPGPTDDVVISGNVHQNALGISSNQSIRSLTVQSLPSLRIGGTSALTVQTIDTFSDLDVQGPTIIGATIRTHDAAEVHINGALGIGSLQGVTIDGDCVLEGLVAIRSNLTVNGTLTLHGRTATPTLNFKGTAEQTLGGTGQIIFADEGGWDVNQINCELPRLTIDQDLTLTGSSVQFRCPTGSQLINRATIHVTAVNPDWNRTTSVQSTSGARFINQGLIDVQSGGVFSFGGSIALNGWTNADGRIRMTDGWVKLGTTFSASDIGDFQRTGGTVDINGILDGRASPFSLDAQTGSWRMITNSQLLGTLNTTAGQELLISAGKLDGATINGDVEVVSTVDVYNSLVINGTLTMRSSFSTQMRFRDGATSQTLSGNATIDFGTAGTHYIVNHLIGGRTLAFAPSVTFGGGTGVFQNFNAAGIIDNQGTINANSSGAYFTITAGTFTNSTGQITISNGGRVFANFVQLTLGAAQLAGAGSLLDINGMNGTTVISERVTVGAASVLYLRGPFTQAGPIDLNGSAVIDYGGTSPLPAIQAMINVGRNGGAWNGTSNLTSSAAGGDPQHRTTLGAIESLHYRAIYGAFATFAGQSIDPDCVLLKYTYYGDVDFNGVVDFDDYSRIDAGFNNNRTGWLNGDADGNGIVDFDDYSLIDQAFNTQGSGLRPGLLPNGGQRHGSLQQISLEDDPSDRIVWSAHAN